MKSAEIKREYSQDNLKGKAVLTESQIRSWSFTPQTRIRPDLIYAIPPQWVISEKLPKAFNGVEYGKKVFAFGINDKNEVEVITTISVSGLKSTHYGLVQDNPKLLIAAVLNTDKVYRAISGTPTYSVFENEGSFDVKVDGTAAYVPNLFVFRKKGKGAQAWVSAGKRTNTGKWEMDTMVIDGQRYLQLYSSYTPNYEILDDSTYDFNWKELEPNLITDGLPE